LGGQGGVVLHYNEGMRRILRSWLLGFAMFSLIAEPVLAIAHQARDNALVSDICFSGAGKTQSPAHHAHDDHACCVAIAALDRPDVENAPIASLATFARPKTPDQGAPHAAPWQLLFPTGPPSFLL
jgi:hypothetical protein